MELHEANKILRIVKTAISADGFKLPSSAETDGLLMLLGKLDAEKYLAPKIKHARTQDRTSTAFARTVRQIAFFRALGAVVYGLPDPVTVMSFTMLHKTLFGDFDGESGRLRAKDASTDGSAHTDPKYVTGSVKAIIAKMNEIPGAPTTAKDDFAGYLSHYMRELIILRPFENGSDFAVRLYIYMFGRLKGFSLGLYRATPQMIKKAETQAFATDDVAPLYTIFSECLAYDHKTSAPPQQPPPRTRREVAKDLCRPTRPPAPAPVPPPPPPPPAPVVVSENKKQASEAKKQKAADDEVIKRAIRLQQKISKLNEQLTELIKPLESKNPD